MSAERRKRYRAHIAADPEKELNFFNEDPLQKRKQVGMYPTMTTTTKRAMTWR